MPPDTTSQIRPLFTDFLTGAARPHAVRMQASSRGNAYSAAGARREAAATVLRHHLHRTHHLLCCSAPTTSSARAFAAALSAHTSRRRVRVRVSSSLLVVPLRACLSVSRVPSLPHSSSVHAISTAPIAPQLAPTLVPMRAARGCPCHKLRGGTARARKRLRRSRCRDASTLIDQRL